MFFLSLEELAFSLRILAVPEGTPLKYFKDDYTRKEANLPDGTRFPYWTRTPQLWTGYSVVAIGVDIVGS